MKPTDTADPSEIERERRELRRRQRVWPTFVGVFVFAGLIVGLIMWGAFTSDDRHSERLAVAEVEICALYAEKYSEQSPVIAEMYLHGDFFENEAEREIAERLLDPDHTAVCLIETFMESRGS